MLAIVERLAMDHGIGWALCDTDSMALARPRNMADDEFLRHAQEITGWFERLNPYDDPKPLFKIEDQNYRLENGKLTDVHEPLYAFAISAKRYCLFNRDVHGRPVIRKALSHGLGHWRPPYQEKDSPQSIPKPVFDLKKGHLERWQYDLWYRIVLAAVEGHPDEIDLSDFPSLNKPARSRYAATGSALLHWFDSFNKGVPQIEQVKPFNFMHAYHVSPTKLYQLAASGRIDESLWVNGLPAIVAPYEDNPERAVANCFDRRTGLPAPAEILATYREVLSDYHMHPESKFENGERQDRGLTLRHHIRAVAVEYIGKEANRWEEQFHLGQMREAQIEYGASPKHIEALLRTISHACRIFTSARLAASASLSRQELGKILKGEAQPRASTLTALLSAIARLESERHVRQTQIEAITERLKNAVSRSSLTDVAKALKCDPSNLLKVMHGIRRPSDALLTGIEAGLVN
jgi:hypothetical protein